MSLFSGQSKSRTFISPVKKIKRVLGGEVYTSRCQDGKQIHLVGDRSQDRSGHRIGYNEERRYFAL